MWAGAHLGVGAQRSHCRRRPFCTRRAAAQKSASRAVSKQSNTTLRRSIGPPRWRILPDSPAACRPADTGLPLREPASGRLSPTTGSAAPVPPVSDGVPPAWDPGREASARGSGRPARILERGDRSPMCRSVRPAFAASAADMSAWTVPGTAALIESSSVGVRRSRAGAETRQHVLGQHDLVGKAGP